MLKRKLLTVALSSVFVLGVAQANEPFASPTTSVLDSNSPAVQDFLMIARQAVQNNPEVAASWHAFIATNFDILLKAEIYLRST
jgi:adhesin transport system outer membrane protein